VLHVVEGLNVPNTEASVFAFAESGTPNRFGYPVEGDQVQQLGLPLGAQPICLVGSIGRYNVGGSPLSAIGFFGAFGNWASLSENIDFGTPHHWIRNAFAIPDQLPNGMGTLMVGQGWGFQLWNRESGGGSSTSNGVLVNW
jgi:hypothetical protein